MKTALKQILKIAFAYSVAVVVFTFFLIAPISMEYNKTLWLIMYSFAMFMFAFFTVTKTAYGIGKFEKLDETTKPFGAKGFVYGFLAMVPYMLVGLIHLLVFDIDSLDLGLRIFHYAFRCAMGPMYFMINTLGYTWYAFAVAYLAIPVMSGISYFMGLKGITKLEIRSKSKDEEDFLK